MKTSLIAGLVGCLLLPVQGRAEEHYTQEQYMNPPKPEQYNLQQDDFSSRAQRAAHTLYFMLPELSDTLDSLLRGIQSSAPSLVGITVVEETIPDLQHLVKYRVQRAKNVTGRRDFTLNLTMTRDQYVLVTAYLEREICYGEERLVETYQLMASGAFEDYEKGELGYVGRHDLRFEGERGEMFAQDIANLFPDNNKQAGVLLFQIHDQLRLREWPKANDEQNTPDGKPSYDQQEKNGKKKTPTRSPSREIPPQHSRTEHG